MVDTSTTARGLRLLKQAVARPVHRFLPPALKAELLPSRETLIPDKTWNEEYGSGAWDFLEGTRELGRYSVIAGYCERLKPSARVLDVGCGTGILAQSLLRAGIAGYVGVDLSDIAIEQARAASPPGAAFMVGDVATFETSQVFDVIVFNEVLYYLKKPDEDLRRFARFLAPGGIFIVSVWYHADGIRAWKRLKSRFEELDRVRVVHPASRLKWDIAVLRP
jgi:2-polyprenyl-3-methyl-5-hydroxy-6-metoxy-1,4-benzoquinol methylase